MNCQRAEVSRLLISRQWNWGRTLVPQIGHNGEACCRWAIKTYAFSHVRKITKKYTLWLRTVPPTWSKPLLCTCAAVTILKPHGWQCFGLRVGGAALALVWFSKDCFRLPSSGYSLLNELTGFTEAALMTCPTTINKVKVSIAIAVKGIVHHGMEIRYEKLCK